MIAQYCTYLLIDQLSWPNDLVLFKRCILKCTLHCALILIKMTSEISQLVPVRLHSQKLLSLFVQVTFKYCNLSWGRTIVTSNHLTFVGTWTYLDLVLWTGINAADPNLSWSWYLHTCTGLPKCSFSCGLTDKSHKTFVNINVKAWLSLQTVCCLKNSTSPGLGVRSILFKSLILPSLSLQYANIFADLKLRDCKHPYVSPAFLKEYVF